MKKMKWALASLFALFACGVFAEAEKTPAISAADFQKFGAEFQKSAGADSSLSMDYGARVMTLGVPVTMKSDEMIPDDKIQQEVIGLTMKSEKDTTKDFIKFVKDNDAVVVCCYITADGKVSTVVFTKYEFGVTPVPAVPEGFDAYVNDYRKALNGKASLVVNAGKRVLVSNFAIQKSSAEVKKTAEQIEADICKAMKSNKDAQEPVAFAKRNGLIQIFNFVTTDRKM